MHVISSNKHEKLCKNQVGLLNNTFQILGKEYNQEKCSPTIRKQSYHLEMMNNYSKKITSEQKQQQRVLSSPINHSFCKQIAWEMISTPTVKLKQNHLKLIHKGEVAIQLDGSHVSHIVFCQNFIRFSFISAFKSVSWLFRKHHSTFKLWVSSGISSIN